MSESEDANSLCGCGACACSVEVVEQENQKIKREKILTITVLGVIFVTGLGLQYIANQLLLSQIIFLFVLFASGQEVMRKAVRSITKRRLMDMNFLMTIATIGAFLIGEGAEGSIAMYLFYIAEFLEKLAGWRAQDAVSALMKTAPETAIIRRDGREFKVHTHDVNVGEIVIVRAGDKVPLDGEVVKGIAAINQASITGEPLPLQRRVGDSVYASSINVEGYLEVKVTKSSDATLIAQITKIVADAQKKRSSVEIFVQRFARIYTPAVIILALLTVIIPPFIFKLPFDDWLYKGLVLLVTSCPCALVLSTPVAMISGLTAASRNGILLKGSDLVESLKDTKVIVFDKTGTLTMGRPEVTDVIALNGFSDREVIGAASSLEVHSKHPLAIAISERARKDLIDYQAIEDFQHVIGEGLRGTSNGITYIVGSAGFMKKNGIRVDHKLAEPFQSQGKTLIFIACGKKMMGIIATRDALRTGVRETLREIRTKGITTVMLTGDERKTAVAIAKEIQIDEIHAELLPQDKYSIIKQLKQHHGKVVMVGDGVNDAPALAAADIGIAMGISGSDAAIATADIALMDDDISKITSLLQLSQKTMRVVKQNIGLSAIIKLSFAVLAIFGWVNLWMAAGIGDMGISLAVILNAVRIGINYRK